jgi:cytochrome c biogenesis protein CcdA
VAIIAAGLADGINPCAFTVIVFFISFLTVMGYRRREMAVIGSIYILAVFLTYLGIGLGFFRILYLWKNFRLISKAVYILVGGLSLFLGLMAVRDYWVYKRTGNTDDMALSLPRSIKNRIHAIVGEYYRRDKSRQSRALVRLAASAFVVGFLISLLESVCTGQIYLPTIIFVLKEGGLRVKAFVYLLVYNVMFVIPLVGVLVFALVGVNSRQFEGFARRHLGTVKLAMAAVFLALGLVLLVGS